MSAGAKLAAFAVVVAAVFGGAMAVGAAVGPLETGAGTSHEMVASDQRGEELPRGVAVAQDGFRLALDSDTTAAARPSMFSFRIIGTDGHAVTGFDQLHERPLHLIVLSRNLVDYHHLHPQVDAAGRWTVDLPALQPGSYRVFADFQPTGGDNLTLGADLMVPGILTATATPEPSITSAAAGYVVTLSGMPSVGESELAFTVELGGDQVRTDPYLGAAGHLVAIRAGDMAYLHVHPHVDTAGSAVTFTAEFPTAGTYRLFFDFSHDGVVHTAPFTVVVPDASGDSESPAPTTHDGAH